MASIRTYMPIATGLGVGAAAGLGIAATTTNVGSDNGIAKVAQIAPPFVAVAALGGFIPSIRAAGRGTLGFGALKGAIIPAAIMGAGAVSGINMVLNSATTYNTIDRGLNSLEREDFVAAHHRRSLLYPLAGAIGGAALAFVPAMRSGATPGLKKVATHALIGGGAGIAGALVITTGGQDRVYRPATEQVGQVADWLWRGIDRKDQPVTVNPELADNRDVRRGTRDHAGADHSRFYAIADASGNGDGILTPGELRTHVASFDTDGDGRLSFTSGEWAKLHAAVVEGFER